MNYRWNQINDYLAFLNNNCTPVQRSAIVPTEMYAYYYQWAVDEYPKNKDFSEWDYFPLILAGDYYKAESNGAEGFFGINLHHLPLIIRVSLITGKSPSDKIVKESIRRYRYNGLVHQLWFVPDNVRQVAVLFHPNTYESSSYNSRFGKPNIQGVIKRFPKYYWSPENQTPQFK